MFWRLNLFPVFPTLSMLGVSGNGLYSHGTRRKRVKGTDQPAVPSLNCVSTTCLGIVHFLEMNFRISEDIPADHFTELWAMAHLQMILPVEHVEATVQATVDGRNPAPVGRWLIPLQSHDFQCFLVTNSYALVQDFCMANWSQRMTSTRRSRLPKLASPQFLDVPWSHPSWNFHLRRVFYWISSQVLWWFRKYVPIHIPLDCLPNSLTEGYFPFYSPFNHTIKSH